MALLSAVKSPLTFLIDASLLLCCTQQKCQILSDQFALRQSYCVKGSFALGNLFYIIMNPFL